MRFGSSLRLGDLLRRLRAWLLGLGRLVGAPLARRRQGVDTGLSLGCGLERGARCLGEGGFSRGPSGGLFEILSRPGFGARYGLRLQRQLLGLPGRGTIGNQAARGEDVPARLAAGPPELTVRLGGCSLSLRRPTGVDPFGKLFVFPDLDLSGLAHAPELESKRGERKAGRQGTPERFLSLLTCLLCRTTRAQHAQLLAHFPQQHTQDGGDQPTQAHGSSFVATRRRGSTRPSPWLGAIRSLRHRARV